MERRTTGFGSRLYEARLKLSQTVTMGPVLLLVYKVDNLINLFFQEGRGQGFEFPPQILDDALPRVLPAAIQVVEDTGPLLDLFKMHLLKRAALGCHVPSLIRIALPPLIMGCILADRRPPVNVRIAARFLMPNAESADFAPFLMGEDGIIRGVMHRESSIVLHDRF